MNNFSFFTRFLEKEKVVFLFKFCVNLIKNQILKCSSSFLLIFYQQNFVIQNHLSIKKSLKLTLILNFLNSLSFTNFSLNSNIRTRFVLSIGINLINDFPIFSNIQTSNENFTKFIKNHFFFFTQIALLQKLFFYQIFSFNLQL